MVVKAKIFLLIVLFYLIHIIANGQDIIAYDNYISIADDDEYVINVIDNDLYEGAITIKIISYTNNGDPAYPPKVDGINIKVKYDDEGQNVIVYEICHKSPNTGCSRANLFINISEEDISAATDIYVLKNTDLQKLKVLDNDLYEEPITVQIINGPKHGTAVVSNKRINYKPDHMNFAKDSLRYQIRDEDNNKSRAYVYLYVNDPLPPANFSPEIIDLLVTTPEDIALNFTLSQFTSVYTDPDNDPLHKIKILSEPANGTLFHLNQKVTNGDEYDAGELQHLKYVPDTDYFGSDEIKWHAADHSDFATGPATILIEVTPVNDAPVAVNDIFNIKEDESVHLNVLANDYDPDLDLISLDEVIVEEKFGQASIQQNQIVFTPFPGFHGKATLTYSISDASLLAWANAEINIAVVYEPPKALEFTIQLNEDEPYAFDTKIFNDHYEDPDGQTLTHIEFNYLPANGNLFLSEQPVVKNNKINIEDASNLTYYPKKNFFGKDKIQFSVYDAHHKSDPADILIDVSPVNDLPVAMNDSGFVIDEDAFVVIDILQNDSDVESANLQIIEVSHEKINYIVTEDNQVKITPNPDYCGNLVILYKIMDEDGGVAQANIYIQVVCKEDVPVANDFSLAINEDQVLIFERNRFQDATFDPDGDLLTAIIINDLAANGSVYLSDEIIAPDFQLSADQINDLKFIPDENWNGITFFTWQAITDSVISQNQAMVTITVHPIDDEIIIYDGFSPNGDLLNDQWIIGNIRDYPENQVKIFNRNNLLIYQQDNYDNLDYVWQGETNVKHFNQEHQAPDDIYYYIIILESIEKVYKGPVILKR